MILCITHSKDYYTIDLVIDAIRSEGMEAIRFNSDQFDYTSSFTFENNEFSFEDNILQNIAPEKIKAVWNKKIWRPSIPHELDSTYNRIYLQEYSTMRNIFMESFQHVPWMNTPEADRKVADNKMYQLQMAAQNGLSTPPTLMTNSAQKVQKFFKEQCKGEMIAKMHGVLSHSMDGKGPSFPTSKVNEEDFEQLKDSLKYCPMIFQPFIKKQYELRVVYIDGEIYTGMIKTGEECADWRQQSITTFEWKKYILPESINKKIVATMQSMNLLFGAMDFIVDNNGNYVFLEVNPQGEWGMIQKFTHQPIAETIAEKLINLIKNDA